MNTIIRSTSPLPSNNPNKICSTLPPSPPRQESPYLELNFSPLKKQRTTYTLLPNPTGQVEFFFKQVGNMIVHRKENGQFIGRTEPFGQEYTIINNPNLGFLGFNPTGQCAKTSLLEEVHIDTKPAKSSINNPPAQLNRILEKIGISAKENKHLQTYKSSDGTTVTLDRSSHPPTIKSKITLNDPESFIITETIDGKKIKFQGITQDHLPLHGTLYLPDKTIESSFCDSGAMHGETKISVNHSDYSAQIYLTLVNGEININDPITITKSQDDIEASLSFTLEKHNHLTFKDLLSGKFNLNSQHATLTTKYPEEAVEYKIETIFNISVQLPDIYCKGTKAFGIITETPEKEAPGDPFTETLTEPVGIKDLEELTTNEENLEEASIYDPKNAVKRYGIVEEDLGKLKFQTTDDLKRYRSFHHQSRLGPISFCLYLVEFIARGHIDVPPNLKIDRADTPSDNDQKLIKDLLSLLKREHPNIWELLHHALTIIDESKRFNEKEIVDALQNSLDQEDQDKIEKKYLDYFLSKKKPNQTDFTLITLCNTTDHTTTIISTYDPNTKTFIVNLVNTGIGLENHEKSDNNFLPFKAELTATELAYLSMENLSLEDIYLILKNSELESDKSLAYHKQTDGTCTMSVLTALSLYLNKDEFDDLLKFLLEKSFTKLENAIATKEVEIKDTNFLENLRKFKVILSEKLNAQC